MSTQPGRYKVDRLSIVNEQVKALAAVAKLKGIKGAFLDQLAGVIQTLEFDPADFGEPKFRTRKGNGVVSVGIRGPFVVRFVVFEERKAVCLLSITPLSRSVLDV